MQTKSGLTLAKFDGTIDGKQVKLYVLTNSKGSEVTILNLGAKIVSLCVPSKEAKLVDVVQGHDSLADYLSSKETSFGAVCGRTGNRIAKGLFTLEEKEYQLAINNGPNSLHGGIKGFMHVIWDAKQVDAQTIELTYLSKDGEENYPGNLTTKVTYHLDDNNALSIHYQATTDKTTIVNLTNHSFFNLSGEGDKSIYDHVVTIAAANYLPTDETMIPLGVPQTVIGTPFDFTTPHTIGERIDQDFEAINIGKGYDHCYVLDKPLGQMAEVATCYSPKTGIEMKVSTTEPGVQVYTANWHSGDFNGKHGRPYPARSAVCFETQHYPDAVNQPSYPTVVLKVGEKFDSKTIFAFGVK